MTASRVVTRKQTTTSTRAGFNLVDDPWIPLRPCVGGPQQDVSLRDVLVSADQWFGYPDDDSQFGPAVLRFLTAFTYVVSDLAGCSNRTEYLSTFNDLWDRGQFDCDRVGRYLDRHKDRFWLFGDDPYAERWMQNPKLSDDKFAVPLVESGLIPHASPSYVWGNQQVEPVTAAAAARYLLAFMCYGRGGGGPKHPDADPTGCWQEGRLRGRVSVHPIGATLFETLLLNLNPPIGLW